MKRQITKKAYVTIMMVIAISAVSIAVVISLIDSGINSTRSSANLTALSMARQFANACLEESLQSIRDNNNYSGNLVLSFTSGACSATTTRLSSSNFTIESSGSSSGSIKRISAAINQTDPKITISAWQE